MATIVRERARLDKVFDSPEAAVADLRDGMTVAVSGFGTSYGYACSLLVAAHHTGVKNLTIVSNSLGTVGPLRGMMLVANGQVSKLIVSFSTRPAMRTAIDEMLENGSLEVELVPQGTLVERMRAAGAGIPAFYTPTGVGTPIAHGKEVREFNGRQYILETALPVDYALIKAYRADRMGNVQFRGSARNFNPSFAKAARVAVVEVDEIVETGEISPEDVGLPTIFVSRVCRSTVVPDEPGPAPRRAADRPRDYLGKPAWTRQQMAEIIAGMFTPGSCVNLGSGMPTLVSNYIGDRGVILHGENGIMKYGPIVTGELVDHDIFNAAGQFVSVEAGASYFDSVTSFEMARAGRLDVVVLGAYQVDEAGNLANFSTGDPKNGGIGGAMDLVAGKNTLIVMMEHRDSKDRPKLVHQTAYPLTGAACVDVVVTDLAVLRRHPDGWQIEKVAPGFTADEVRALSDIDLR